METRQSHKLVITGSIPVPATKYRCACSKAGGFDSKSDRGGFNSYRTCQYARLNKSGGGI